MGVPIGCEQASRWTGEQVNRCPSRYDRSTRRERAWNEILILVTRIQSFDYLPVPAGTHGCWILQSWQLTTDRLLVSVRPAAQQELYICRWDHWFFPSIFSPLCYLTYDPCSKESRGGVVGWGTALQAGSSRVRFPIGSLGFFIDVILPALGSTQPVT